MNTVLEGRRVLVVGASAGIGRAIATSLVGRGARVAFCARRAGILRDAVADAGGGAVVAGDVCVPEDCARVVAEAVVALGGLDVVCYAAAVSPLRMLTDMTADDWRTVFETNVTGASLITRAALAHLSPGAIVAYLSSESAGRPRHGLVAYAASKLALEETIRGFRVEHPDLRFMKVTVGATTGTEFGLDFDPELAGRLLPLWVSHGEMRSQFMEAGAVAEVIVDQLASALKHPGVDVQEVVIRPPGRLMTDPMELLETFEENTAAPPN